jgi:hypothetical protein
MFGGMFGVQANNLTGIILPAEDILKAAKQVPAAGAAEEKKSAGAAEDKKDK